jgi:hypothetical protein
MDKGPVLVSYHMGRILFSSKEKNFNQSITNIDQYEHIGGKELVNTY